MDGSTVPIVVGAVVVAAGRGERAGVGGGPKQYRLLGGKPVIARTLEALSSAVPAKATICVIHADDRALFSDATAGLADYFTVVGGSTRQQSVLAGLGALRELAPDVTHVMIHDAARPHFSPEFLARIIQTLHEAPASAVLPVLPIAETLKQVDAGVVTGTVPRETLWRAQTPQVFPLDTILALHREAAEAGHGGFTDDAALFEHGGLTVRTVEGDPRNIKITYPEDFHMADSGPALPDIRTGNGYDVHRFGPGDHVTLCGIAIPHDLALSGHSDADVALHALTDALLATCGAGDIGDHFPPSDPQWKGAPSEIFLQHAARLVQSRGGTILNADVSLIAEAPKIAPHREAMCENLSRILGISRERCSVKATTNEKMGFVGRSEGIAAIATASVRYGG